MACGVPVIATTVGGIPEIVQHEITGLLVPQDSETALAEALERVIADASLRSRLGAQARKAVECGPHREKAALQTVLASYERARQLADVGVSEARFSHSI